jgi:Leucine-rich repeat (LRR) protein
MTTTASEVRFSVAGTRDITIDWGDGRRSNVNDASFDEISGNFRFSQDYSDKTARNIVITGNVTELYCQNIGLTVLDVSGSPGLTKLYCKNNQLTALNVGGSPGLMELYCNRNQLTALDVSRNTALKNLEYDFNQIKNLDVSKNTGLEYLSCIGNQLTASELNYLFRTLPDNTESGVHVICISRYTASGPLLDNPGIFDCDRSIATKKGWSFISDKHK